MAPFSSASFLLLSFGLGLAPFAEQITAPAEPGEATEVRASTAVQDTVLGQVRVRDTDRPIPGAEIRLLRDGVTTLSTRSGPDGRFLMSPVAPGTYALQVEAPGFEVWTEELVVPEEGAVARTIHLLRTTFALDPVRILAEPLGIRREETDFGARLDARALRLLPTPYDPSRVTAFVPGASADRIWGGADIRANLYQVDGLPQTHPGTGGPLLVLSPAWVQAVEVRGLGAGAEQGNFQGALVNVITRSGGTELQGEVRSSLEAHPMNATNVLEGEVGRERALRAEVEGEVGGPILPGRLHFFVAGHAFREEVRAQSRLREYEERFLPFREERNEARGFGKLTWFPGGRDRVELSGAASRARVLGWGQNGYLAPGALGRLEQPSAFVSATWRRELSDEWGFELRGTRARAEDRLESAAGTHVPASRLFTLGDPPSPVYHNSEFELDRRPESRTLAARVEGRISTGPIEHRLLMGTEFTRSRWRDVRRRTAGFSWRPVRSGDFDPFDPSTWPFGGVLPSTWGGEVDLHARMEGDAAFIQNHVVVHPRLTLAPGLRWGRWQGDILPGGRSAARIRAVSDRAWEPRLGAIFEVPRAEDLLLKGHWGIHHQNLLAQFFDRVEGGDVFSNWELWYLTGGVPPLPTTAVTEEQRDALAEQGRFRLVEEIRLNETGPVSADYRQPHVEQWVVGVEKGFGDRVRVEAVWVDRSNRDMVALRDRNLADNYWRFENIVVMNGQGDPLLMGDEPMVLPEIYIPHDFLLEQLRIAQEAEIPLPPGMTFADTLDLAWNPDLWIENVPDARRHMQQFQLTAHVQGSDWGGTISLVHTRLTGNLASVTGYAAGSGFEEAWDLGAGPWVRPNEQVNFQGPLPGYSPLELKVLLHGELPRGFRGGAFIQASRGEYFTPYFRLTPLRFLYAAEDGSPLDSRFLAPLAGHRLLMRPRGAARYADRFTMDIRLEREVPVPGGRWFLTADLFNVWNSNTSTRINPAVNFPDRRVPGSFGLVDSSAVFGAVWERIPPRTLRLGVRGLF